MSETRRLAGIHWDDDWALTLEFKLVDLWIGAFWKTSDTIVSGHRYRRFDLWVCVLPCLPLHLTVEREVKESEGK